MVGLDFPIQPVRQQLIDFTIPGGWPITRPTVSDRKNITYLKPSGGGIAHTGGHYFGRPCDPDNFDQGIDEEFRKDVTPKLESRFPELKQGKIAAGFSGLYEDTPDKMPLVGETEVKGFIVCAGWSGHGFKHGPFFGVLLKELIQNGKTSLDISAFDPGRFKSGKLITTEYAREGDRIPPAPYS
jgi:glycine/D-amino acid oxidase-like deaminating enzyme